MPQHYIKIEIKGDERNLPKEAGEYYAFFKGSRKIELCPYDNNSKFPFERNEMWVRNFDWYLLPVPELQQPEQLEIESHLIKIKEFLKTLFITDKYNGENLKELIDSNQIKIDEVRKQSRNNTVGPSEDEISAILDKANFDTSKERETAYDLIKYALFQCKAIDLKQIEKQLLDRFGFTDEGVDAENQVKIFSFIDWLSGKGKESEK